MLKYLLSGVAMMFAITSAAGEDTLVVGKNYSLKSEILDEERPYSVYLPKACEEGGASSPCPVVYMLDGNYHFHYATGMLQRMSLNTQIPAMILVAIPNTKDRTHDLTPTNATTGVDLDDQEDHPEYQSSGGGDDFLDFVEKELIPEIESKYNPMPFRLLVGHSFGGLITLHSFVERPNLFQAHIAVDPRLWWDRGELVKRAEKYLKTTSTIRNRVFISMAEHAPKGEAGHTSMETGSERFAYAMQASPSKNLEFGIKQFKGEDHGSVVLPSLYYGLLSVFDGYKNIPPSVAIRGLDAVKAWYRDYLSAYNIELAPPDGVISELAQIAGENKDYDTALQYYQYTLDKNPDSAYTHYLAGKIYKKAGMKQQAIEHFEKSLELEPKMANYVDASLADLKGE